MLLIQALAWEVARAFTKLGIAIAARRPIMATTIMISTSVKPPKPTFVRVVLICFFRRRELPTGGLIIMTFAFTDCLSEPLSKNVALPMPLSDPALQGE